MFSEITLGLAITGSVLTSTLVWLWLKEPLREMITQLCQHAGSSSFWLRYTLVMLLTAPLAVVIFFLPEYPRNALDSLRQIMLTILLGHFFAFALVGRSVFNAMRRASHPPTQIQKD